MWALAALCILPQLAAPSQVAAQGDPGQEILRLVNELRVSNGLSPLIWDGRLASAAQNQANYMATNNIYSHTGEGGSTPQSRASAAGFPGRATENVVGGTGLTPGQGVIWWRNSPTHLNTLLSPRYTHVGVGSAFGFDQNFYALVAGSPSAAASAGAGPAQGNDQLLAPVAPIVLAAPREDGSIVHTVGTGQSFWIIAARYEVPLDQLYLFNNLNEESVINPGDEIVIRLADGQDPPPTPTPPPFHIVREGDSWWTIAAWHKLSVDDLLWLNSSTEDSVMQPGDEIRIRLLPGESPPPTPTPQLTHIVSAGETAWDIALRYGIDLESFMALNDLGPAAVISVGAELKIATATATAAATATAPPTELPSQTPEPTSTATSQAPPTQAVSALNTAVETPPGRPPGSDGVLGAGSAGQIGLLLAILLLTTGLASVVFVWRKSG